MVGYARNVVARSKTRDADHSDEEPLELATSDIRTRWPAGKYVLDKVALRFIDEDFGWGLFAKKDLVPGEVVYSVPAINVPASRPIRYKHFEREVFIDDPAHYMTKVDAVDEYSNEMFRWTWFDIFLNHSCEPNVRFEEETDFRRYPKNDQVVIATTMIKSGAHIVVDYDTIHWIVADPFVCNCGSRQCRKGIFGLRYRPPEVRRAMMEANACTAHVKKHYHESGKRDFSVHPNRGMKSPTHVHMLVNIKEMGNIDLATMQCVLSMTTWFRWSDPDVCVSATNSAGKVVHKVRSGLVDNPKDLSSWAKIWRPKVNIEAVEGGEGEEVAMFICRDPITHAPNIVLQKSYKATIASDFSLRRFPFDRHCMKVFFEVEEMSSNELRLQLHDMKHLIDARHLMQNTALGGYSMHRNRNAFRVNGIRLVPDVCQEEWARVMTSNKLTDETWDEVDKKLPKFANVELRFDISRNAWFHASKTLLVLAMLYIMAIGAFFIDPSDLGSRSGLTVALLLASSAFQFSIAGSLPQLPYNTLVDDWIMVLNVMFLISFLESVEVSSMKSQHAKTTDQVMALVFLSVGVLGVIVTIIVGVMSLYKQPAGYGTIYPDTLSVLRTYQYERLSTEEIDDLRKSEEVDWEGEEESQASETEDS